MSGVHASHSFRRVASAIFSVAMLRHCLLEVNRKSSTSKAIGRRRDRRKNSV